MNIYLQSVLLVTCVITFWYVMRKIRKSQMQIEDAVFWIAFSILLLTLCLFPNITQFAAKLVGVASPINFLFLFVIFLLLFKLFSASIHISQLDNKIKLLSQKIALENNQKNLEKNSCK